MPGNPLILYGVTKEHRHGYLLTYHAIALWKFRLEKHPSNGIAHPGLPRLDSVCALPSMLPVHVIQPFSSPHSWFPFLS